MCFLTLVAGAGWGALGAPGFGLTLRCGPPRTAFGGPPALTLGARLLRGTKGGGNTGIPSIGGGKPGCPSGVIGMPPGGYIPAAASCTTLGELLCIDGRPGAGGG